VDPGGRALIEPRDPEPDAALKPAGLLNSPA
jgi:hypothetical protein